MRYDRVCGTHVKQSRSRLERLGGIPEPDAGHAHGRATARGRTREWGDVRPVRAGRVRACPGDRTLELIVSRPVRLR